MVVADAGRPWRDRKRYLWTLGLLAPSCALLPSQLVMHTDLRLFWWLGPIVFFLVIPLIDTIVGVDGDNPPDEALQRLTEDKYYRWCTYLCLPFQFAGLIVAGYLWAYGTLSVVDKLGLAVTVGLVGGIGINAAHELGHRREEHERWLAKIALSQTAYGHFFVEHNLGHHARAATPEDPASARYGEWLWTFLPRSVFGGMRSAWRLERNRLQRIGRRWWSWENHILQAWAMTFVLFGGMLVAFGIGIAPYLALQAVVGFTMLEIVNYVEHYGLLREQTAPGQYEPTSQRHSWNSDRLVTNIFLFHLQRHSDHHANPGRRYQTLRSMDDAPQMPAGYATMVVLAMIPPIWQRVVHPLVLEHYGNDITKANRNPRAMDRLPAI